MRPIWDMTVIQIDVTNACHLRCANCTRFVGHHSKPYFMDLDTVRLAIDSLEGFPGRIGLMGGEPALHPRFEEICAVYRERIPDRRRRELWTSGLNWEKNRDFVLETFDADRIAYNDHTTLDGKHQPLLVAAEEVVEDRELMWQLIDQCWVQEQWSASITPKGGFFCEIAAAMDMLFDGPGGYPLEKGWWRKGPADFRDQVERSCPRCSGAIPLARESDGRGGRDGPTRDLASSGNLARLERADSPKLAKGRVDRFERIISVDEVIAASESWEPSHFRSFVAHGPEDVPADKRPEKA